MSELGGTGLGIGKRRNIRYLGESRIIEKMHRHKHGRTI